MHFDLPVIILKGFVVLPYNELKIDVKIAKSVLDMCEELYDNKALIITDIDAIEETFNIATLPKLGSIALIENKLELPNGNFRLTLKGLKRAIVSTYLTDEDQIYGYIEEEKKIKIDKEDILVDKIKKEIKEYIDFIPYASNSYMNVIKEEKSLSKITDILAPYLTNDQKRLFEYLKMFNPLKRAELLIEDIYREKDIYNIEQELDIKLKKELDESQKELFLREKIKVIKQELGDNSLIENDITDLKNRLNNLNVPNNVYKKIEREIKRYETIPPTSPEVSTVRNYIEWMLELPWNNYTIDNDNLEEVRNVLDESHSGLDKVKNRIIEYLGVKKLTNAIRGPILCLVGPPGVGKTTLAYSIAHAMKRKFVKISVGGITDEAEILGHRRTYIGASPGKIISSIKKAKSSNPVFLIDEIDKMTKTIKGDPASALLEILDPEQNKYFVDNYIEEEYDLSKVMFIATANYIDNIPEPLKDRLEIVELSGYTELDKIKIAKQYLIPKICKEHGINYECVIINNDILLKIIRGYTKESGVRDLERLLATIIRKVITSLSSKRISVNKLTINNQKLIDYLGEPLYETDKKLKSVVGVVNGLAYTPYGGDVLPIEVTYFKGNGNITLTGSLGEVMKESAMVAINYIKSNYKEFDLNYDDLINNDIHIHIPNGSITKEGPSAGIALTTALISIFKNKKIDKSIAFTGEITLRGDILPIGGLKEKTIGAMINGIKKIYLPYNNMKDIKELPNEIKENIEFVFVKNYKEIYKDLEV